MAALAGKFVEMLEHREVGVGEHRIGEAPHRGEARALGGCLAFAVFSGEEAARERKEGENAHAELTTGRHEILLDSSIEQIVLILGGDIGRPAVGLCGPRGVGHLPSGVIAVSEVADFAGAHEGIEG